MPTACSLCDRVTSLQNGDKTFLVHEFATSLLLVGDHQTYPGYCVLVAKAHVRELHELPSGVSQQLYAELMNASQAIAMAYKPWKLNHASYGNMVPHVHWHVFPRYESDTNRFDPVWKHSESFDKNKTSPTLAKDVGDKIRKYIK